MGMCRHTKKRRMIKMILVCRYAAWWMIKPCSSNAPEFQLKSSYFCITLQNTILFDSLFIYLPFQEISIPEDFTLLAFRNGIPHSANWPWIHYAAEADLELLIPMPRPVSARREGLYHLLGWSKKGFYKPKMSLFNEKMLNHTIHFKITQIIQLSRACNNTFIMKPAVSKGL